jgi:hypothetical protein
MSADFANLKAERDRYRAALIECATIAGADISGGVPTAPPIDEWAVREVREMREAYDEEHNSNPYRLRYGQ